MTTTPEGLRGLKALAEKATPGPWHHCQPYMVVPSQRTIHGPVPAERVDYVSTWPDRGTPPGHRVVIPMPREAGPGVRSDDMAFIAAANPATVLSLLAALEEAEGREKNHGVARFVDAEEIAELMEAGSRTWMPMDLAKPERNGSIIVMTSDDMPVIGQAFWHEHGDGTWALHWSAVSPKEDCWNDPITETNKGLACWQPMPEGPCEARVKAMGSPGPHMAALLRTKELEEAVASLTARAEASEQREAGLIERLAKAEGDRDALRAAIGFRPGPLKDVRDDDIVIIDAKALRPAMVQARRQRDDAQIRNAQNHCYAAEEIRAWVKERFGKWITYKTAGTLADRIFGSERAALTTKSGEAS